MATSKTIAKPPISPFAPSTPPSSPVLHPVGQTISLDCLQQLLKLVHAIQSAPSSPASPGTEAATQPLEPENEPEKVVKGRASRMEYTTVNEIWDKAAYKYKLAESPQSPCNESDDLEEYLFIERRQFDKKNLNYTTFLDIKSEELRAILRDILENVRGASLREDKPSVQPELLFNHLQELQLYHENRLHSDSIEAEHLHQLIRFLSNHFATASKSLRPLLEHGEITFDLLWALFKPNALLYTTCTGTKKPRCVRFESGEEREFRGEKDFQLECRYLDYNGKTFGEASESFTIDEFRGVKKINSLNVFPLDYHPQQSELESWLKDQGAAFISLKGVQHRQYEGDAFLIRKGQPDVVKVSGRIMVDAGSFKDVNPTYRKLRMTESLNGAALDLGWVFPVESVSKSGNVSENLIMTDLRMEDVTDEDLMTCSATVMGYSLEKKAWLEFAVANIKDIQWNPTAFGCLELAEDKKRVLQALVESQLESKPDVPFDDFIAGKGEGIIVLLHGPPGVGKTLTAEALSEYYRRPLYTVCAGELGVDPGRLEERLSLILHLARHWNAILLLDEADCFLKQRSHDPIQSGLISVFLRKLEYFQGVMFLTTNRVTTFDEAMLSRVHFAIKYPDLTAKARKKLWKALLQKAGTSEEVDVNDTQLSSLTERKLNGRQIKNTVRTGQAMARKEWRPLSIEHLEVAIAASEKFECDFQGVNRVEAMHSYA